MSQPRWTVQELMEELTAIRAERYVALVAEYGSDVDAMLVFPWTPPVPKEPPFGAAAVSGEAEKP